METFNIKRAKLKGPDFFNRFKVSQAPQTIQALQLSSDEELIVFEHYGKRYGFLLKQLDYHHVAQGSIDGKEFAIIFCGICHSAMGFNPIIKDQLYHLSAGGLYDGTVILVDDETETYWNHMTGKALHGSSKGLQFDTFPIHITTVQEELTFEAPAKIWISKPPFWSRILTAVIGNKRINSKGMFPPGFIKSMGEVNDALPKLTQGLGVIINDEARFYPKIALKTPITDQLGGQKINISIASSGVPQAFLEDGSFPMQLFCRWYGFTINYPHTTIYAPS